tara:strand:- start:139 stop:258 length:120 start_codon:yes stop_codon:yes gene_type:complete
MKGYSDRYKLGSDRGRDEILIRKPVIADTLASVLDQALR